MITSSSRKAVLHGVGVRSNGGLQMAPPGQYFYNSVERIGFVSYCNFMVIKMYFNSYLLFLYIFLFSVFRRYEPGVDVSAGP